MSDRLTLRLWEPTQAFAAINQAWKEWLKPKFLYAAADGAQVRYVMEIRPESKTRDQEEKYHAIIGEIAEQAQHLGSMWDAESWKRLLLDEFSKDTDRRRGKVIPNLSGDGVVEVGLQSRKFSRAEGSEFIEWLQAWCAERGVTLADQERMAA